MCKEKLLSIIIPTYNAEKYLDKCLSSLILEDEQLFEQLEVLVINDGSPDHSRDVAQKYVDKYPDVYKIIDKENGGHGSGINVGAENATGIYFKVLDADDWVDKDGFAQYVRYIKEIVENVNEHSETSDAPEVLVTPYKEYDITTQKETEYVARPNEYNVDMTLDQLMDQWQTCHMDLHFWGVSYNTDFYKSLNYKLVEGVFYEDQEYATVPMSYAKKVRILNCMVYVYRVGDVNQSVFGDTQVKRREHLEKVLEKILQQDNNQLKMPDGGDRYWRKKTAMVATSYYQIMLLKNKDKKMGRAAVEATSDMMKRCAPDVYEMVERKRKGFEIFSYIHISNNMYEFWAPKLLKVVRSIKGQKV